MRAVLTCALVSLPLLITLPAIAEEPSMFSFLSPRKPVLATTDYNRILGATVIDATPLAVVSPGTLNVTSGTLVACDPLAMPDMPPLTFHIPKGRYPLDLIIADDKDWGERVALAVLKVRDETPVRYELAGTAGQDMRKLKRDEYYGFGVDAGMAALMDVEAQADYLEFINTLIDAGKDNLYDDYFAERLAVIGNIAEHSRAEGDWLDWEVPNSGGKNVIMFASGLGDGYYPVYTGKNTQGDIVNVVVDFQVLLQPDE